MKIKLGTLSQIRDKLLYRSCRYDKNTEVRKLTKRFIFIIDASGSGTTMLTRILSEPVDVIGLGGNFDPFPKEQRRAGALGRIFREATKKLWVRKADYNTRNAATQALFHIINDFFNLDFLIKPPIFYISVLHPSCWVTATVPIYPTCSRSLTVQRSLSSTVTRRNLPTLHYDAVSVKT